MTWFFWLNTLPNTTQFLTFYYFFITILFFSLDINYLLIIFNYFFLLILNHTCLMSPRSLHFILLNFITSSSTFLHIRFAFFLVCNFCVFHQYQCGSAFSQVLSLKFLNTIFFSCTGTFVHLFSFHFFFLLRFFSLQNANLFWF